MSRCQGTDSRGYECQQESYGDSFCYFHGKVVDGLIRDYMEGSQLFPVLSGPRSHIVGKTTSRGVLVRRPLAEGA